MRWNFGGNLQPVRMICEYDWKECPTAVVSYLWTEVVTDVVDGITGDAQLWRILAVMLLCSMLFHTVYCKMRWLNKSEADFAREDLIKVGFKMQDLELKINILTYRMQYGTWPLPHEIPTPSLNELRNVKLTLSNTSKQNMWTKHHLHGYISKCIRNSEDDNSANKYLPTNERGDLAHQNFLSHLKNGNSEFKTLESQRSLKILRKESECKDYERLIKTAKECRKYMDELNDSNKSLGLFDNSSDVSDQNSLNDICDGTESERNNRRFFINPKKWEEIYKYKNREAEAVSDSDLTASNQMFSVPNLKHKDLTSQSNPLKNSKNISRLLPPGLSITFLSDKFKTLSSSDKCLADKYTRDTSMDKPSTNETLNKVKEKLESLHDIEAAVENTRSLNNGEPRLENKKSFEMVLPIRLSSKINSHSDIDKVEKLISSNCDSSNVEVVFAEKFPGRCSNSYDKHEQPEVLQTNKRYVEIIGKTTSSCFGKVAKAENTLNSEICPQIVVSTSSSPRWNISNEPNENLVVFPMKTLLTRTKIEQKEKNLSPERDSSTSFVTDSTSAQKNLQNSCGPFSLNVNAQKSFDSRENVIVKGTGSAASDCEILENNINLNYTANERKIIPKTNTDCTLSPQDKSLHLQTPMETDEDTTTLISLTSSQTELSKDSDTDEKSTTTLLREALEFKKALLLQIHGENETYDEKNAKNENSECDSDDTTQSKTDNHFRPKLLDIIAEEQSAGSSTEKTSRTYILSKSINETNLSEDYDKSWNKNNNANDSKCDKVIMLDDEICGDSKSVVTASSSEYFSVNNLTDNEHVSGQRLNHCIEDVLGDREKSSVSQIPEAEMELNVVRNYGNNNIVKNLDIKLKTDETKEKYVFLENKLSASAAVKPQDILKQQITIQSNNNAEKIVPEVKDVNKIAENIDEMLDESSVQNIANKSEAKIKFYRSLSSIDSEKAISWNSMSESSSNESISQFVNTLTNIGSKSIEIVAEEKLMMLNSTDYEGRNFATAGDDLQLSFNSGSRRNPNVVLLSDINTSKQRNCVLEEILGVIADSAIMFRVEKTASKERDLSISNEFKSASTDNHLEVSNSFQSHGVLKLDQEKLQRKQNIYSKLKTLDAFTKPLDIGEYDSEKTENDGDLASPLTGRTVVCRRSSNTTNISETLKETESDGSDNCGVKKFESNDARVKRENIIADGCDIVPTSTSELHEAKSEQLIFENEVKKSGENENKAETVDGDKNSNVTNHDNKLESKKMIGNWKINHLSKSSITNFSTDTSDSYFDVSNHDFAVSSIILTSQNSNFAPNNKDYTTMSDTSSSYVDACDQSSKIASNSCSTESNEMSNLAKKYCFSKSQTLNVNTDVAEEMDKECTGSQITDVTERNNVESKHESLTKTQFIPKCTSSLPSNDKRYQLSEQRRDFPTRMSLGLEQGQASIKDQGCAQSSISLNQESLKCWSSLNLDKINTKGKTTSKSCIPILKSRIETPRRGKSMEIKARSRSPVRRSNTPTIQCSRTNEDEKKSMQLTNRSRRSLNSKQSYILPSKNSEIRQEVPIITPDAVEKEEDKIAQVSTELATALEKSNLQGSTGHLTKECTVIYINIISDGDRNEAQAADARELVKHINENDLLSGNAKVDSNCQSISVRNLRSNRAEERKSTMNVASHTLDNKLCKDLSEGVKNEDERDSAVIKASLESGEQYLSDINDSERANTANKLLSTSTLQLSNALNVERREIEVSAKPSVKNTSTSVSDFADSNMEEKRSFYNQKSEVFVDASKDFVHKEKILLSEMLVNDPNFFECKKTHKLYNKLGLGLPEQQSDHL